VDHAARAPNPQSAAYLKLFMLDRIPPTKAVSGRSLVLLDKVPVAEYPDYDPLSDIGKVSIQWIQTSGPPAELLNPNTHRANVVLPNVSTPTPLTFRITVKNASGARTGELEVMVLPPR
jgi:hypothetical protein